MICKTRLIAKLKENYSEDAVEAYFRIGGYLKDFEEAYQGSHASDSEFAKQLLEDIGDIPDLPSYVHIDWEATASEIMMDYDEEDGYYFRVL